jgi:hypothetical protein
MIQTLDRYLALQLAQSPGRFEPIRQAFAAKDIGQILRLVIGWMLFIAGAIAVIYLIWAGYQYITAAGDPEKATKAKNAIIHAVIGIVVIVLSYVILVTVMQTAENL